VDKKLIIYKETILINNKSYFGKTIKLLEDRKKEHVAYSQSKYKKQHFQRALKKYGSENFKWKTIDKCDDIIWLNELEKYYIYYYDTFGKNGYNSTTGGERGYILSKEILKKMTGKNNHFYDKHHTEKTKKKISELKKGKTQSKEHTVNISKGMKGKNKGKKYGPLSKKIKRKISEALKGQIPWNAGKHLSEEHKKKISDSSKGKNKGNAPWNKGTKTGPHTEEHRKKNSKAQKKAWRKRNEK
jgi:group I intron endonuclease